ncbi:hypothetical protein, partial [Yersinia aldovae]
MNSQGFNPKDLEEISSRKLQVFRINKRGFKELSRNALLGSIDVAVGSIKAAVVATLITEDQANESADHLRYTWEDSPYKSENRDI